MATYHIAKYFSDVLFNEWGVSFKPTAPSAAMSIYTTNFFDHHWYRPDDFFNTHERLAYYGGRTELFRRGIFKNIKSYDVNSMYPAVMLENNYPDPSSAIYHKAGENWQQYLNKYEGIYSVDITAPDIFIQPLPFKNYDNPSGRLMFPCGTFHGYYCAPELRQALKDGYTIDKCSWFIHYKHSYPYFREFVNTFYTQRMEAKRNGDKGRSEYLKRILVSLYGKTGEKHGINGYVGSISDYDGDVEGQDIVPYRIGGIDMINIPATEFREAPGAFPCIAAYVTSYARIKLYNLLTQYKPWIIACDTDSLKVTSECPPIVSDQYALGALKDETEDLITRNYAFIKVKCYIGADPMLRYGVAEIPFDDETDLMDYPPELIYPQEKDRKKNIITVKGVSKRATVHFNFLNRTIEAYDNQPVRTKTAIMRHIQPCIWRDTNKVMDIHDQKREWVGKESRPVKAFM
jgi:hypothetical protein